MFAVNARCRRAHGRSFDIDGPCSKWNIGALCNTDSCTLIEMTKLMQQKNPSCDGPFISGALAGIEPTQPWFTGIRAFVHQGNHLSHSRFTTILGMENDERIFAIGP